MFTMRLGRAVKLAVLGAVAIGAVAVRASDVSADKMPSSYVVMMKMKPMDVFNMMDTGKKQYITKEEFMKFQEVFFEKMDKDKNGQVSQAEFTDRG